MAALTDFTAAQFADVDIKTFICQIQDKAEIKSNFSASPHVGPGVEITIGNRFRLLSNFDEYDI